MSISTLIRRLTGATSCTIFLGALAAQTPSDLEERIQRIQDRIPPATMVKGEPVPTTKLADRMAALHVPGASIAVIHDGKIEGVFRELCNIFTRSGGQPTTQLTWQVYREMRRNLPIILRQSGANSIFNTRVFKDLSVLASDCADRFVS